MDWLLTGSDEHKNNIFLDSSFIDSKFGRDPQSVISKFKNNTESNDEYDNEVLNIIKKIEDENIKLKSKIFNLRLRLVSIEKDEKYKMEIMHDLYNDLHELERKNIHKDEDFINGLMAIRSSIEVEFIKKELKKMRCK